MLQLWNIISDKCLYTYNGHTEIVTHMVKNKSKNLFLSTSDDSTIRIWNMNSFPESESIYIFYFYITSMLYFTFNFFLRFYNANTIT